MAGSAHNFMTSFFASGHAADVVLAVLALEAVWLVWRRGWSTLAVLALLGPAALLVLAVRGALLGAAWPWIALALAAALPLHLIDLRRRLGGD